MKAIIVDDEPPARREMRRLLGEHPGVSVVGEASDLATARGLLLRTRADVVFLDIRLGRASGFDLLSAIDNETAVVFVTAFEQYAVQAFEASAVDYLLKPVDKRRLRSTIERLMSRTVTESGEKAQRPRIFTSDRWTFIDSRGGQEFVELATITHLVAEEGGTRLFTGDRKSRSTDQSLAFWEKRLSSGDFVRVHRSAIVNLRFVESMAPWSNYTYRIRVRGWEEPIEMSRRYASRLRELLA